uniref:Uncharacterized protein n=1 Tax=Solanum tuberosum TaxID=4113 RepID=M1AJA7_SOLTU
MTKSTHFLLVKSSFSAVDYDVPLSATEATQQELPKEELHEVFGKLVTFECV